jgi:hypothetical protein
VGRILTFTVVYLKLLAVFTLVGMLVFIPLSLLSDMAPVIVWVVGALILVPVAWRFDEAVRQDDSGTFKEPWR